LRVRAGVAAHRLRTIVHRVQTRPWNSRRIDATHAETRSARPLLSRLPSATKSAAKESAMVRPLFADVRRMRSDVSRDDVRHAVADAWSLLAEISSSLAEAQPGEPQAVGAVPVEPGWGKLAELAGTLEMSSRTLRVMLVRRGIDAARESSTFRVGHASGKKA
jgi:hypothetical protein